MHIFLEDKNKTQILKAICGIEIYVPARGGGVGD